MVVVWFGVGFFFYLFDCFVLVLLLSLPHSLSECYYGRYSLVTSIPWGYPVVFLLREETDIPHTVSLGIRGPSARVWWAAGPRTRA